LTERYFYESFRSRDELAVAVFDRIAERAMRDAVGAAAAAPHDARAKARAAIGSIVALITEDPRKGRVLFIEAMGSEALIDRRLTTLGAVAELIGEQARDFYGDRPSSGDVELSAHALAGAVFELLLAWIRGELEVPPERLVAHCTELFVAAAGVRSS
ncbi:MAG: TetR/AcrR family transcriptional regulator, partial [Solirubrobacterales bacterium]